MQVVRKNTGKTVNGGQIESVTLINSSGTKACFFNYGLILQDLIILNHQGRPQNIVLGLDDIEDYLSNAYLNNYPYLGAVIGRYANRIAGGTFCIDGKVYQVPQNNGDACLHGGREGFDRKVWDIVSAGPEEVVFRYLSIDGEEGFPGNLAISVAIKLTDANELIFDYAATTDAPTPVNLTHHSYFNLAEEGGSIAGHIHAMPASRYLEQHGSFSATGKLVPVEGTALDFTSPREIGALWDAEAGYDQSFVLDKGPGELTRCSVTIAPGGKLMLEVYTTEPVVHFYTGRYLDVLKGRKRTHYRPFEAFCIETQHHPNAVNVRTFPDTVLRPGEVYRQTTSYKISIPE